MRPRTSFRKDNRGAVAAITIIMMVVFFALLAIVTDLGHLMLVRNQLQNAADAGALAGAGALYSTGTLNWTTGQNAATQMVLLNKADTLTLPNPVVQAGVWNTTWTAATAPANLLPQGTSLDATHIPAIKVSIQKIAGSNNGPVALTFGQIFGISTVNVGAHATAIVSPNPGGPFNSTLFSNLNLIINGSQNITGSVFSNNDLTINGSINISGAVEGANIDINGAGSIGSAIANAANDISVNGAWNNFPKSGGATNIPLSNYNYSSQIAATAATTYATSQIFNGVVNLAGNISVNGNVTLNGSINDTGTILATGNITINGSATIVGSNQLFIYSSGGNITINGSDNLASGNSSVIIYAPNGQVIVNGSFNMNGDIIANQIIAINGSVNINGGGPVPTLAQFARPELVQ